MSRAYIDEIFSSIQGEGVYVGRRNLFIRFHGCSSRCDYCDTPSSMGSPGFCSIEKESGKKEMYLAENPLTIQKLNRIVMGYTRHVKHLHRTLALTGGEPLEQAEFLQAWLPSVKKHFTIYLETNGIHAASLKNIINHVDIIAMDVKLPSATGQRGYWEEHENFLKVAQKKDIFVKIVVTPDTDRYELLKAGLFISKINPRLPTILQPADPLGTARQAATPSQLMEYQAVLSDLLEDVRIIPQVHKMLSLL